MHSCSSPDSFPAQDVFWFSPESGNDDRAQASAVQTEFTISELADEFGLTHRALRFYEGRRLLSPQRAGRRRIFSRSDRDRLALILQGKKFGFTLAEISRMIEAQCGQASEHALNLSAEACLEKIAHFEQQMREAGEALAELRRIHLSLCVQTAQRGEPKGR